MAHNRTCRKVSLPSYKTDMQIPDWDHVALSVTILISDSIMKQKQQIVQTNIFLWMEWRSTWLDTLNVRQCHETRTADCPNTENVRQSYETKTTQTLSDSTVKHSWLSKHTHCQQCETQTADCPNTHTVRQQCETQTADCPNTNTVRQHCETKTADCPNTHTVRQQCETQTADCPNTHTVRQPALWNKDSWLSKQLNSEKARHRGDWPWPPGEWPWPGKGSHSGRQTGDWATACRYPHLPPPPPDNNNIKWLQQSMINKSPVHTIKHDNMELTAELSILAPLST